MDVTENSPTNAIDINDEESVDVSMGIDAASTENTEEKELSPTKKKVRANVGKRRLRSPAWKSFDLLPVDEDNTKRGLFSAVAPVHGLKQPRFVRHLAFSKAEENAKAGFSASQPRHYGLRPRSMKDPAEDTVVKSPRGLRTTAQKVLELGVENVRQDSAREVLIDLTTL
ncbi:unnamed protein product [Prunus armeniaca]